MDYNYSSNKPLLVIVGETTSGKTNLAHQLAIKFHGEIINADSTLLRKELSIGTDKPSKSLMEQVNYHMINLISLKDDFNVAQYKKLVDKKINDIHSRNKLPIIVGGSGLYINSVIYNYDFPNHNYQNKGVIGHIDTNNILRENTLLIGIRISREELSSNIKARVDLMLNSGLEQEVKNLISQGFALEKINIIGYKEWKEFFNNQINLEEVKKNIIKHTKELAKKQRTWFSNKNNNDIFWVDYRYNLDEIVELITTNLKI